MSVGFLFYQWVKRENKLYNHKKLLSFHHPLNCFAHTITPHCSFVFFTVSPKYWASLLQPTIRDPTKVSHPIQKQQFENLCCFSQPSANHLLFHADLLSINYENLPTITQPSPSLWQPAPNQLWKSANHYPTIDEVIEHWTSFEKQPTIIQPLRK